MKHVNKTCAIVALMVLALSCGPFAALALSQDTVTSPTPSATPTSTPVTTPSTTPLMSPSPTPASSTSIYAQQDVQAGTQTISDGTYYISTAMDDNAVIDVASASYSDGANAQLWNCNRSGAQRFQVSYCGDGFYTITNMRSNKVLEVAYGSDEEGANVWQWEANGTDAQEWRIDKNADGTYTLTNKESGKVLDCENGQSSSGTNVWQWGSNGSAAQKFSFNEIQSVTSGMYTFSSAISSSSQVFDVEEGHISAGTNLQTWDSNGTCSQIFNATSDGNGCYVLSSAQSSMVLDVQDASSDNKANVQLWSENDSDAQKWYLDSNADGTCTFINKGSGKALDIANGSTDNGTNIWQFDSNGTSAQKFNVNTASIPQVVSNGLYTISSSSDYDTVLDVYDGSLTAGANIQLWSFNYSRAQNYTITYQGDGWYTVDNVASGLPLDADTSSSTSGCNVRQWNDEGTSTQLWRIVTVDGHYCFMNKDNNLFLDAAGGSVASGTNIQTWYGNDTAAQEFDLQTSRSIAFGAYSLKSALSSDLAIDVYGGSAENGANIQIWNANGSNAQKFYISSTADGNYVIENVVSLKALDCTDEQNSDGTNIQQWEYHDVATQQWNLTQGSDGYYTISSVSDSSKVLDIQYGDAVAGTNLQLWTSNASKAQKFELVQATVDKYLIMGTSETTVQQMVNYWNAVGCSYPEYYASGNGGASNIWDFCSILYDEANQEGVRADVVFAQAMHETGWLQFGGDVKVEQYNFSGLGATGNGAAGDSFSDIRTGLRAQVQHLKAYASTEDLNNDCVDTRFSYVTRGCAPYVEDLGGQWATDSAYGDALIQLIANLHTY